MDVPFRELGFTGVPFRSNVLLQPTTDCLVHLSDPPFLIITLSEIEIAHLERVQFGLKNFDMVFVFKDFHRPPIQINTIPMSQLDNVKDWLDSVEVAFTEGPVNLNWSMIMKTVNEDPAEFYRNGGWSFLGGGTDVSWMNELLLLGNRAYHIHRRSRKRKSPNLPASLNWILRITRRVKVKTRVSLSQTLRTNPWKEKSPLTLVKVRVDQKYLSILQQLTPRFTDWDDE